mmetsp:Transcript_31586/g.71798  ORF Transcript_31586/g.71798 Transcript_31586/m.71798 type:complete len:213 (-) Transcript_31586:164-802(-)
MIAFLGPAQAMSIVPFCTDGDLAAWAGTHPAVQVVVTDDAVWRQMLSVHYRPPLELLGQLAPSPERPEALVAQLPEDAPRQVYQILRKTSPQPFILEPRSRLLLEIHELREWDKHQRQFTVQRQAECIASSLGRTEAAEDLRRSMAPEALELVSLQVMMGGGGAPRLLELSGVEWTPSVDVQLRLLMEKRSQRRRMWWQRQREYLLQDLEWH